MMGYPDYGLLHCSHPRRYVKKILERLAPKSTLTMVSFPIDYPMDAGEYGYTNTKDLCNVAIADLPTLNYRLELLLRNKTLLEVGIRSRIDPQDGRAARHLPMIDFIGKPSAERMNQICLAVLSHITTIGTEFGDHPRFQVYDSGNSYHAYFNMLLKPSELSPYMQFLSRIPEIDQKWLRHCLTGRQGGILRWSSITGKKGLISKFGV